MKKNSREDEKSDLTDETFTTKDLTFNEKRQILENKLKADQIINQFNYDKVDVTEKNHSNKNTTSNLIKEDEEFVKKSFKEKVSTLKNILKHSKKEFN
ncbi:hypothetical protein HERIO_800 [Hepatospora eriocheir]|uniref:Uncharacterized protein n=1 Tax=Hepatospora eriocheir TaxID=1081669 RepID=A0A1X0QC80_9MICR|nr:hypothetical protein HERIO_800 [Hepatospora eriocheir]